MKGQKKAQRAEVATLRHVLRGGFVQNSGVGIDGGAHVGTWSAVMAGYFAKVIAFEPNPALQPLLAQNLAGFRNVEIRAEALMDVAGPVAVFPPRPGKTFSGWQVRPDPEGQEAAIALDDLELRGVGLIKLDLEGAELLALHGAARTIARCRPALIIEFGKLARRFGHGKKMLQAFLHERDYREFYRAGVDRVFVPQ